jgi:hypothetical protein
MVEEQINRLMKKRKEYCGEVFDHQILCSEIFVEVKVGVSRRRWRFVEAFLHISVDAKTSNYLPYGRRTD